jgi:hypothetical protein
MNECKRIVFLIALLSLPPHAAARAQAQDSSAGTSTISGRVSADGRAAPGVTLVLQSAEQGAAGAFVSRTTTDGEGRFRINGVAAGRYNLTPVTPAFVAQTDSGAYVLPGKALSLGRGEAADGVDFVLTRGGVITGRVTDEDGRPVIATHVRLIRVEAGESFSLVTLFTPSMLETDDRGAYRIYGVPPGRYILAAGESAASGAIRAGGKRGFYRRTFYPNAPDEWKAETVDVTRGGEVTGIDIALGRLAQTYDATGRIIDAKSGRPMPDTTFAYVAVKEDGTLSDTLGYGLRSGPKGEFLIGNLLPGSYAAFVISDGRRDFYSEPVFFEVLTREVSGLEIKVLRGSTLSGTVIVEGAGDAALLSKLSAIPLGAFMYQPEVSGRGIFQNRINPDGTFSLNGLRPGRLRVALDDSLAARGFTLLRVERNGGEQRDDIDIAPDAQVTGVRIVLAFRGDGARQ